MTTIFSRAAAAAFASLLFVSAGFAQTATAPAAAPASKMAPADKKARSAESVECSKQADEKGLHGKERKKFRSECMKEAKSGAAKTK